MVVDKIYRFENLATEIENYKLRSASLKKIDLPNAKTQFRKDKRNYRDILTETERKEVAELLSEEIELLGYRF